MKTFKELRESTIPSCTPTEVDANIINNIVKFAQQISGSFQPDMVQLINKIESKLNQFGLTLGDVDVDTPFEDTGTDDYIVQFYSTKDPVKNMFLTLSWRKISGKQFEYSQEGSKLVHDVHLIVNITDPEDIDDLLNSEDSDDEMTFVHIDEETEQLDESDVENFKSYIEMLKSDPMTVKGFKKAEKLAASRNIKALDRHIDSFHPHIADIIDDHILNHPDHGEWYRDSLNNAGRVVESKVNEESLDEARSLDEATIKTKEYSWGKMKTIQHGSDWSIPLHPEHQEAIASLEDEEEHKFKDETGSKWTAKRSGDTIHFTGGDRGTYYGGNYKTSVLRKHLTEETDSLDEEVGIGRRIVHRVENGNKKAVVYKRYETGEHEVEFHRDGKKVKDGTYFTDDVDDAKMTANHFVGKLEESLNKSKLHPVDQAYVNYRSHRDSHDGSEKSVKKERELYKKYKDIKSQYDDNGDKLEESKDEIAWDRSKSKLFGPKGKYEVAFVHPKTDEEVTKTLKANDTKHAKDQIRKKHGDGVKIINARRLDEESSKEELLKRAKQSYEMKMKNASDPASRAQAKEDYDDMVSSLNEESSDETDTIKINVPAFIRCLEHAMEDVKEDAELHEFVENLLEISKTKDTITTDDYEKAVSDHDQEEKAEVNESANKPFKTLVDNLGRDIEKGHQSDMYDHLLDLHDDHVPPEHPAHKHIVKALDHYEKGEDAIDYGKESKFDHHREQMTKHATKAYNILKAGKMNKD